MKNTYPNTVQEWLENLYSNLKKEGFFEDQELGLYSEERVYYHFQDILGVVALQSWLKDGEVKLTEKNDEYLITVHNLDNSKLPYKEAREILKYIISSYDTNIAKTN